MSIDLKGILTPDVLDLFRESVCLRDLSGRVLYWNNAATHLYGWTPDQALGKNAHELLKTRFKEPLPALEAKLLAEEHWCGNLTRTTAAGNTLVVDIH